MLEYGPSHNREMPTRPTVFVCFYCVPLRGGIHKFITPYYAKLFDVLQGGSVPAYLSKTFYYNMDPLRLSKLFDQVFSNLKKPRPKSPILQIPIP
jgi:hypothetical protein